MAFKYKVKPETIANWISKHHRAAERYAKDPETMAAELGLDLRTALDLTEEQRKSVVLGFRGKAVSLDTNGPMGTSGLSGQNN